MVQDQLWQNLGTKNIFDVKIYAYKLRTSDLTLKVYEPIWVTCSKTPTAVMPHPGMQ